MRVVGVRAFKLALVMVMFDIFSKREARRSEKKKDVYQYVDLPNKLRVQICHIAGAVIMNGNPFGSYSGQKNLYERLEEIILEEEGMFYLPFPSRIPHGNYEPQERMMNYFLNAENIKALDVVELLCRAMERFCSRHEYAGNSDARQQVDAAIQNINERFLENSVGYQFTDDELIRIDSQIIHKEAVVPALEILRLPGFAGAQSEFLKAHEHYRHGRHTEALIECHKAFESIMKAICDRRKWIYDPNKAASHLIDVCIKNGLLPAYQQNYMTGLKMVLESAVPTPRNKTAAHGAGTIPIVVPAELASYVIHLTASTLLFLANADKAKP